MIDDLPTLEGPDTTPDADANNELVEAVEWLRRAGVVSGEGRPAFAGFFEEVVSKKS